MDDRSGATERSAGLAGLLGARRGELAAVAWAFAWFFCLLSGYYVIRPIREEMGIAGGVDQLQWLFTGTFVVMLLAVPVYFRLVAHLSRSVFVPLVYGFFGLNLVAFWFLFRHLGEESRVHVSRAFFVWASVYNLFVISVFWSFLADTFRSGEAKRLFPLVAAGGTLGALAGSAVTRELVGTVGTVNLLWIPAVLLLVAIVCMRGLDGAARRLPGASEAQARSLERPTGGGILSGLLLVAGSRYLLGLCAYMFLTTLCGTVLYFQQAAIVDAHFDDPDQRTRLFATMNFWVQVLTLVAQLGVTSRVIARLGLGLTLALLPLLYLVGFAALGAAPVLAVLVPFQVLRRATGFGFTSPARQVLYTVVSREAKYKSKSFIDTVVFRGGDAVSGWLFAAVRSAGAALGAISLGVLPVCILWLLLSRHLGRRHAELEAEQATGA